MHKVQWRCIAANGILLWKVLLMTAVVSIAKVEIFCKSGFWTLSRFLGILLWQYLHFCKVAHFSSLGLIMLQVCKDISSQCSKLHYVVVPMTKFINIFRKCLNQQYKVWLSEVQWADCSRVMVLLHQRFYPQSCCASDSFTPTWNTLQYQ